MITTAKAMSDLAWERRQFPEHIIEQINEAAFRGCEAVSVYLSDSFIQIEGDLTKRKLEERGFVVTITGNYMKIEW